MAQKKANEVESWLRRPDPASRVVLVYGPDRGLVSERARAVAAASGLPLDDPFAVIRLDAGDVDAQPGRLLDEAATVPMFGGNRLIWVRGAGAQKQLANEIAALLETPPPDALVLVEAGELRKGSPLRASVEAARAGMALPCYADEGRALDGVIDEVLGRDGLAISTDARQLLRESVGGDRLATRGEIEKLALYRRGASRIEAEDVRAVVGDASGRSTDDAVDALLSGSVADFDRAFAAVLADGAGVYPLLAAAMRQFQALRMLRAEMDEGGKSAGAAVAAARPAVFFSRRRLVEQALTGWGRPAIERALERLQAAVLVTRRRPALAEATARQALLALAVESARARR